MAVLVSLVSSVIDTPLMKFKYEDQSTPTFRNWIRGIDSPTTDRFDVVRILCNREWRTITFCTEEFRVNFKFKTAEEYESNYKPLKRTVTKHCRVGVMVNYAEQSCEIEAIVASDADESAYKFEVDDFGFNRA